MRWTEISITGILVFGLKISKNCSKSWQAYAWIGVSIACSVLKLRKFSFCDNKCNLLIILNNIQFREKWSINRLEERSVFELSQDMSQTRLGALYQIYKGVIWVVSNRLISNFINRQNRMVEGSGMCSLNITKATQLRNAKNLARLTMKWKSYAKKKWLKDKAQFVVEVFAKTSTANLTTGYKMFKR